MKSPIAALALIALVAGLAAPVGAAAPLDLGSACGFAVLGASGVSNNNATIVTGDLGSYPTATISGFPPGTFSGTSQGAQAAQSDLATAYAGVTSLASTGTLGADLGGTSQTAGVYDSTSGAFAMTGNLVLDGGGNTASVFIFRTTGAFNMTAGVAVTLSNGAQAQNVFWVVGSSATLGATATLQGSILAFTAVTLGAGDSVTGRVLAMGGLVTLDTDTVTNSFTCPVLTPTASPTSVAGTATVTETPAAGSPTDTPAQSPTASATPAAASATDTPTQSPTASATPAAASATDTPTQSPTASETPAVGSDTASPSPTDVVTATATQTPSPADTSTISPTPTVSPSLTPGSTPITGAPVYLGSADGYSLLAGQGFSITGTSSVSGYVGSYPILTETGTQGALACTDQGGGSFTQAAAADVVNAYADLTTRASTALTVATELGGTTLLPGVYDSAAGTFGITTTLTLDAGGNTNAIFVFKTASTLTTGAGSAVALINGAQAKNVFWVVESAATLGTSSSFVGTIIAYSAITLNSGASVDGRLLTLATGAITLDTSTVNSSSVSLVPCDTIVPTASPSGTTTATPNGSGTATSTPNGTATITTVASPTSTSTGGVATASPSPTDSPLTTPTASPTASPATTPTVTPTAVPTVQGGGPVNLGGADGFAILAGTGFTLTGASTASGYAASYPTSTETGLGSLSTTCAVETVPVIQQAKSDLAAAFADLTTRAATSGVTIPTELSGAAILPGVYVSAAGTFGNSGAVTLDAQGNTNAIFIFSAASTLITASGSSMTLTNGAQAKNVFWAVGSSATLGTGSQLVGTIIALTSATLDTNAVVQGRVLAINGAVTMDTVNVDSSTVSLVPCTTAGSPTPSPVVSPTLTPTPGTTGSATPSATMSATPGSTGSATPAATLTNTAVTTLTNTPVATLTNTPGSTRSATPSATPVYSPIVTATATPTVLGMTSTPSPTAALTSSTPGATPVVAFNSYFYPSPVTGDRGAIAYDLRSSADVTLKIYSVTGRLAETVQDTRPAGWQSSAVDVSGFSSGTYYYVVTAHYATGATQVQAPGKFAVLR